MCIQYPITNDDLTKISGVGSGKAMKYGKPFLKLIEKYIDENDIERPQDFLIKSVVNKSGLKVHIIKNIDRRQGIEDIAKAKGIEVEKVLSEMEAIVSSGTRINIRYSIEELLDDDSIEDIIEYFRENESDNIKDAYEEFDGDFSEIEIRMVRIQFYSDFGN